MAQEVNQQPVQQAMPMQQQQLAQYQQQQVQQQTQQPVQQQRSPYEQYQDMASSPVQEALVNSTVQAITGDQAAANAAANQVRYDDPDLHYPGDKVRQGITVFLFGAPGTWKTTWAGQWPKPVFLSVGVEGGDDALVMLPSLYGVPVPPVYQVNTTQMMKKKIEYIASNYSRLGINTVVIDSITYYIDLWISQLMEIRFNDPKIRRKFEESGIDASAMSYREWGMLAMHIRDLAMTLHRTSLNVIWIALEREIKGKDQGDMGSRIVGVEPFIRGEAYVKLPGMCKMIIHAHKDLKADPKVPGRMMVQPVYYTSPNWQTKLLRHKYGNAFPEGKLVSADGSDAPTFMSIWNRIGKFVYYTT